MMDFDDMPKFEKFHRPKRKESSRQRRMHAPSCIHKLPYYTNAKAEQARLRALSNGAPYIRVYRCDECPAWHLTHKKPI